MKFLNVKRSWVVVGMAGVLVMLVGAMEFALIHKSFRALNHEVFEARLDLADLYRKVDLPQRQPAPYVPPASPQPERSYVDNYVVLNQLVNVLDEWYFDNKVQRGSQKTTFQFPDGEFKPLVSFQIRNTVLDEYPNRSIGWTQYEGRGFSLDLRNVQAPNIENWDWDANYVQLSVGIKHEFDGAWKITEGELRCEGKAHTIRIAATRIYQDIQNEGMEYIQPEAGEVCENIKVLSAEGKMIEPSMISTSTEDVYQFSYSRSAKALYEETTERTPPMAYTVIMGPAGNNLTLIRVRANATRFREGLLKKEEADQADADVKSIMEDIQASFNPEQCNFGYGSCY
ncbi:hypothetical protein IT087_02130 [Candidatus Uhrbacteria bacterium]|nr:hypothetical protein [Candidatus Uhrbacteria bacterium]